MPKSIDPVFYLASSADARTVAPELIGQVALVVTSPPYHNAISYERHQEDRDANYRVRSKMDYAHEYLSLIDRVWTECWHLLRPSGYLVVNVGSVLDGGYHFPLPQDVIGRLMSTQGDVKWQFIRSILWNKVTAGVKRAGSVIQHKLPGYWYPNIMTESLIVVKKPGRKSIKNTDVPREWWENIWDLAPVPPRTVDHPAPFPEDIPHRLIRMFTNERDIVFDPFVGVGSTTKAAYDLYRKGVGFDLSDQYLRTASDRITRPSSVRPKQLYVVPIRVSDFHAGKSKGKTRHGAGLATRRILREE